METSGVGTRIALPVSLPCELWQGLGHRLGGTGFGDDHVQRGRTAAAIALVEVVDQVLVVGERVHGFHVPVDDAELVVEWPSGPG